MNIEQEISNLYSTGLTLREIAKELNVSYYKCQIVTSAIPQPKKDTASTRTERVYNISGYERDVMLIKQENRCKCCDVEFTPELRPCIDHNHKTGQVRSLLCRNCNLAVGNIGENIETATKLLKYVEFCAHN